MAERSAVAGLMALIRKQWFSHEHQSDERKAIW